MLVSMRFVDKDKQGEDSYAISLPLDTNQNNCTDSNSLLAHGRFGGLVLACFVDTIN